MTSTTDSSKAARDFLRHTIATLAYRGGKAVRDVPDSFAGFRLAEGARTPAEILAHIGDLFDWALSLAQGEQRWQGATPLAWQEEVDRLFATLNRFDGFLASDAPLKCEAERLFQGPIADAFTHVGQIALLRRAAAAPVRAENYFQADIVRGRVGRDQSPARREF